jgi:DNA helicase-2/ATP-dependent DNA helicase PcrA
MADIRCHYCGGYHAGSSEVRACWQATQASRPAAPEVAPDERPQAKADFVGTGLQPVRQAFTASSDALAGGAAPAALGRSVVIRPGMSVPKGWQECVHLEVGPAPDQRVLDRLEHFYLDRIPLVIEWTGGTREEPLEVLEAPVWSLDPGFCFPGERLDQLVWANAVDARQEGTRRWALAERAIRAGARPLDNLDSKGGSADVILPDGRPAFCDGGPLQWFDRQALGGAALLHRIALDHSSLVPLGANETRAELAEDQRAAVTHPGGSARIIAPAGSGKTRVLTERARHLLNAWRLPSTAVCLVAFNKRAAEEMKQRTTDIPGLQVRTLNSLALAIVNGTGRFGEGGRFVETIDERAVREIIGSLVDLPRRLNTDPVAAWIAALSTVRLGLRDPIDVEAEFQGEVEGLGEVFDRYRQVLLTKGLLDFDEQIYRAIEILVTDPEARRRARLACRVMLVDEFQDLTPAHLLLVRLLAGPAGAVFGVGDDDQTIYGYAGASPDWLINYGRFFPGAGHHGLTTNYRCPASVVRAARTLLTHNHRRVEKQIVPAYSREGDSGGLVTLVTEDAVEATVDAVSHRLAAGALPADIAVLTRVNNSLAPVQLALSEGDIAVSRAVDTRFLERTGVRAVLAWLRIASRPTRIAGGDIALTARRPPRAMSPKVIEWMAEQRNVGGLESLAARMGERDAAKISAYARDIEQLGDLAASGTTADVFSTLRDQVGLAEAMAALDGARWRLDRSPQTDDLDILVSIARLHPDPAGFEPWLRQGLSRQGDAAGVTLSTVHAVKGREWPYVVVHDVTHGLFPHRLAEDPEEERRVFHVAITRCGDEVTVVAGGPPSPFIAELSTEWVAPPKGMPLPEPVPARPQRAAAAPPDGVVPEVGMKLKDGGYEGTVEAVDRNGVLLRVDKSLSRIPFGRRVSANGVPARLIPPPPDPDAVERVVALLKTWRIDRSRADGKPAYVILHDSTLEAIAGAMPESLGELALLKGIGPSKLEAFGDEILAILDSARADGETTTV